MDVQSNDMKEGVKIKNSDIMQGPCNRGNTNIKIEIYVTQKY